MENMRSELLSIGEAARLKSVSIKALRYYERIGIFKPAYIDPNSGYRYYSLSQMIDLDVILTCIELSLPLKDLMQYRGEDGSLDMQGLLAAGRETALTNLKRAQISLKRIDSCLEEITEHEHLRTLPVPYQRTLPAWSGIFTPWKSGKFNARPYIKTMADLYLGAEASGVTPIYFQELFVDTSNPETPDYRAYIEILEAPESPCETDTQNETFFESFPTADYVGHRIDGPSITACFEEAFAEIEANPGFYLATEVWDSEVPADSYVIELLRRVS